MLSDKGTVFVVSAPSGAGKTTLVKALVDGIDDLGLSISHTTRPKRPDEVDGVNYHFVSQEAFDDLKEKGQFVESAEVFGFSYGTSKKSMDAVLSRGDHIILEIDWQGARQVRRSFDNVVSIFILPPSMQVLSQRLSDRDQDEFDVVASRMAAAKQEISHYFEFDYLVVNDDFNRALKDCSSIINAIGLKKDRQSEILSGLVDDLLS